MFLTPVVYPAQSGLFAKLTAFNPLAPLVCAPRDLLFTGYLSDTLAFSWATIFALIVFLVSWRIFHLAETRMAERI